MICFFGKRTGFVASPMVTRKAPGSKALLLLAVEAEAIADIHYFLIAEHYNPACDNAHKFCAPEGSADMVDTPNGRRDVRREAGETPALLAVRVPKILRNNEQF